MKIRTIKTLLIAAVATLALAAVACGGDDNGRNGEGVAGGGAAGGGTIPVTQALLESLPEYPGATLVREWLTEGGRVQVREFAVAETPQQAADAVTRFYRDYLVGEGWQESEARAAVSSFTKDGRSIVLGRAGPQLQEAPAGAATLHTAQAPSGTGFFFTLEANEG